MASVFRRKGAGPWLIQFFDQHGRRREKSSRTTDRRAAERIASKLEADVALRREGVVDPRQDRFAEENRKPLAQHIREYLQHCRGRGVSAKLIRDRQMHLEWILAETRASRLSDLTLEPVERVLMSYWKLGRSPRTVNTRRESLRAFASWCRKTGRTESNQLELLTKLDENSDRRYIRRPLTDDELERLLEVAAERGRRTWYLAAALAGLRRSELIRLTWGSVDVDEGILTIRDGKAKREDVVPLHPDLLAEFKAVRPAEAKATDRVFRTEVTNLTRKLDFKRAGIEPVDALGRVADLHGLRATLGTRLARAGVAPQVAQRIMRHSDYRTTLKHYTMLSLADTTAAMHQLPGARAGSPALSHAEADSAVRAVGSGEHVAAVSGSANTRTQQIPQQSTHDAVPDNATECDEDDESLDDGAGSNVPSLRKLRDRTRTRATTRDGSRTRRERVPNPLGTDCSIQLSYGRARPRRLAPCGARPNPTASGTARGLLQAHRAAGPAG
jgi:integrase